MQQRWSDRGHLTATAEGWDERLYSPLPAPLHDIAHVRLSASSDEAACLCIRNAEQDEREGDGWKRQHGQRARARDWPETYRCAGARCCLVIACATRESLRAAGHVAIGWVGAEGARMVDVEDRDVGRGAYPSEVLHCPFVTMLTNDCDPVTTRRTFSYCRQPPLIKGKCQSDQGPYVDVITPAIDFAKSKSPLFQSSIVSRRLHPCPRILRRRCSRCRTQHAPPPLQIGALSPACSPTAGPWRRRPSHPRCRRRCPRYAPFTMSCTLCMLTPPRWSPVDNSPQRTRQQMRFRTSV